MFCTIGNGRLLFSWQEDFFFTKRTQHYFNLIMVSWIPEMTMEAACRTSVFLLNYFFKCQTSDHVYGLVENKAVHFGFLESCYISRLVNVQFLWQYEYCRAIIFLRSKCTKDPERSGRSPLSGILLSCGKATCGPGRSLTGPAPPRWAPPLWNRKERQAARLRLSRGAVMPAPESRYSLRIQWSLLAQRSPSRMSRFRILAEEEYGVVSRDDSPASHLCSPRNRRMAAHSSLILLRGPPRTPWAHLPFAGLDHVAEPEERGSSFTTLGFLNWANSDFSNYNCL